MNLNFFNFRCYVQMTTFLGECSYNLYKNDYNDYIGNIFRDTRYLSLMYGMYSNFMWPQYDRNGINNRNDSGSYYLLSALFSDFKACINK